MTGRWAPRRLVIPVVLVATLATGCGVRPSGVIRGGGALTGPAEGIRLYMVSGGRLTVVLRPTDAPSPAERLVLLADGPTAQERAQGLTSEVPSEILPSTFTSTSSGTTVTLSADVGALSATAVDQIVCTASDAEAASGQAAGSTTVTLVGDGRSRGPQTCPPTG